MTRAAEAATAPAEGLPGLLDELRWRGMLHEHTPGLPARLATGRVIAGYNGFDPSGPSLHIGSLVPVFGLLHLQRRGGRPIVVVGGGTGMIGDPSGRSSERNLLDRETIAANAESIHRQLERFLDFSAGPTGAVMVNNLDWLGSIGMLDFLRDVGKHFTIPYMLAKDSVQTRLDRGLSFTEFSYMLLQSADFEHLYRSMGVEMQMGGADQWGNITAGLELIRRVHGGADGSAGGHGPEGRPGRHAPEGDVAEGHVTDEHVSDGPAADLAHGLCYPLFTNPSGEKFGKTAEGTSVWLDPAATSPYAFYQYWMNTEDSDIGRTVRFFTLMGREEVEALEAEHAARPEARHAQRALAFDVTARTHGATEAGRAKRASEAVFSGAVASLDPELRRFVAAELPRLTPIARASLTGGMTAAQLAVASGASASTSEARRLIAQGGLYVEDARISDPNSAIAPPADDVLLVRIGKRRYQVIPIEG